MNKEIIAGIIFIIIWNIAMFVWSGIKNIRPDYSNSDYNTRDCQDFGEGKGCW
jgi:hypothetical protein